MSFGYYRTAPARLGSRLCYSWRWFCAFFALNSNLAAYQKVSERKTGQDSREGKSLDVSLLNPIGRARLGHLIQYLIPTGRQSIIAWRPFFPSSHFCSTRFRAGLCSLFFLSRNFTRCLNSLSSLSCAPNVKHLPRCSAIIFPIDSIGHQSRRSPYLVWK
ncbi:hypothetical protein J3R30DRAFT_648578 [Lentinula aciculospora]|uniref:Uncharacterized protein n=1 Tax=Lentinula aciculospora TaxID=153920 RepID=A0A9W9A5T5_9AGAR|nr:hypothetical protein J3R30DRAFT_648578 [Lentinula aciculospora]